MPHVRTNYLLLKSCLRKKVFATAEEAELAPYRVYECPICKKWHRASPKEAKEQKAKEERAAKERLKRKRQRTRKAAPLNDPTMGDLRIRIAQTDAAILFSISPKVASSADYRLILAAAKAEKRYVQHISMERDKDPVRLLKDFIQENDIRSFTSWPIDCGDKTDDRLITWVTAVLRKIRRELGFRTG